MKQHAPLTLIAVLSLWLMAGPFSAAASSWPQYAENPFEIVLDLPGPEDSEGGIIAADLDNDGLPDYLVTVAGHIACYAHAGSRLWVHETPVCVGGSSERYGLPGHHGPGVTAGDIDGDGRTEALYLTRDSTVQVIDGATGEEKWRCAVPPPAGAEKWEHLIIANLRGKGDRDLLLQATNREGYRTGRYLAAFRLKDLRKGKADPIWQRDDFPACAHNGARIADLDGDGRDEIFSAAILSPEGRTLASIPLEGHVDSIFAADVRPDIPGLEVVALEEGGGNRVFLYNCEGLIWEAHFQHSEPQNAAVGDFAPEHPGLEIWCRSRHNEHQHPFVFDSRGKLLLDYKMDDVAPEGWTIAGVEVICTIDWTGEARQYAAAKERHESGDIAIFDPAGGHFLKRFSEKADRLFVADVAGDWREEILVLNGNRLHIYHNPAPNPRPDAPRRWKRPDYRRSRMTWNYYSP
jgi:hypothetical protein